MHKLVDQPIRVDQIDLNVWQGEGGHRCIYSLVQWAVPPSAGINSATAGGSEEAAVPSTGSRNAGLHPSRARIWWCRGKFFVPYPCFFSKKTRMHGSLSPALLTAPNGLQPRALGRRNPSSCFLCRFPVTAPSPGSPHQLSHPGGGCDGCTRAKGSWEVGRASPLPTSSHLQGIHKQAAPATSQAFPPAADPGNIPASTVGFPWRTRKSLGPVVFLPRS